MLTEWLDATYSAFKVPIGIAVYQDYSTFGVLSCLDIIAGGESSFKAGSDRGIQQPYVDLVSMHNPKIRKGGYWPYHSTFKNELWCPVSCF